MCLATSPKLKKTKLDFCIFFGVCLLSALACLHFLFAAHGPVVKSKPWLWDQLPMAGPTKQIPAASLQADQYQSVHSARANHIVQSVVWWSEWYTVLELVQLNVWSEWLNSQSVIGRRGLVQWSMVNGQRCSVLY